MPQARFNLTFSVKRWFFDREIVKRISDKTTREALAKAGATVRMIARRSMRYVTSLALQQRQVVAGQRKRRARNVHRKIRLAARGDGRQPDRRTAVRHQGRR
jgi:hypothetical protein